ncbi:hypothetical protein CMQ_6223 [Grosmannia clavigera kw1407]|uniref:Uncharacterized protein n=1 Tax=Grosmannia clavigera (strain kw1407 / UAMH 11150) TaxID=655863 RepID=F0XMR6_GROCL|nr:uncharacterized protein CMQ_6223 [Grosmannia clavigera kw1407]EFX01281.1 hypothetical protein CMQ_6223 [Grosmannia clavigera kw1407]
MRHVFETRKRDEEAWERDAEIMAAAQWILWHGQTMFKFIIYNDDSSKDDARNKNHGLYKVGDDLGGTETFLPRSVERWRYWKARFEAVDNLPATDECKTLAARSARMMGALEDNMLF